jgi:hypothetical protein
VTEDLQDRNARLRNKIEQLGACPSSGGIFGRNLIPFEA